MRQGHFSLFPASRAGPVSIRWRLPSGAPASDQPAVRAPGRRPATTLTEITYMRGGAAELGSPLNGASAGVGGCSALLRAPGCAGARWRRFGRRTAVSGDRLCERVTGLYPTWFGASCATVDFVLRASQPLVLRNGGAVTPRTAKFSRLSGRLVTVGT